MFNSNQNFRPPRVYRTSQHHGRKHRQHKRSQRGKLSPYTTIECERECERQLYSQKSTPTTMRLV